MPKGVQWIVVAVILGAGAGLAPQPVAAASEDLLLAIRLPGLARETRSLGVPEPQLQTFFTTARERRIGPGDLVTILTEENDSVRRHGPIDNFGAFVQQKLDAGLRGRELAAAIRAEHAARGIGKGRPGEMGKPGQRPGAPGVGRPEQDHGRKPAGEQPRGKSEGAGKSDEHGKKGEKP